MGIGKVNFNHPVGLLLTVALLLQLLISACSSKEFKTHELGRHIRNYSKREKQNANSISEKRFPLQKKQVVVLVDGSPYNYAIVDGAPQKLATGCLIFLPRTWTYKCYIR
jgi:hypothetical protein